MQESMQAKAFDNTDGRFDDPDSDDEEKDVDGRFGTTESEDPYADFDHEGPLHLYAPGADPDGDLPEPEDFDALFYGDEDDVEDNVTLTTVADNDAAATRDEAGVGSADGEGADTEPDVAAGTEDGAAAAKRREANRKKRQKQKAKKTQQQQPEARDTLQLRKESSTSSSTSSAAAITEAGRQIAEAGRQTVSRHQRRLEMQRQKEADSKVANADLFVNQLKLLPFLVQASQAGVQGQLDVLEYVVAGPGGAAGVAGAAPSRMIRIAQYPQGVGCAATAGKAAWSWRVWDGAKALARVLETHPTLVHRAVVLELGAGAGLASLAAARLGARAVLATDLPEALPLLIHNLERNGARVLKACARAPGGVCCPSGHALKASLAATEDHMCNVCGLEDALAAGIEQGDPVHACRQCDFDVCGRCADRAVAGEWSALPGWWKLTCAGFVTGVGTWHLPPSSAPSSADSGGGGCESTSESKSDGALMIAAPWDLLAAGGVTDRADALLNEALEQSGALPTLVLVADVSCSAALIQPLVASLVALRARLPSGAIALMAHEKREAKVDAALEAALDAAKLKREPIEIPSGVQSDVDAKRARLCLWRVPLTL